MRGKLQGCACYSRLIADDSKLRTQLKDVSLKTRENVDARGTATAVFGRLKRRNNE